MSLGSGMYFHVNVKVVCFSSKVTPFCIDNGY